MDETALQKQHILDQLKQLDTLGMGKLAQLLDQVISDRRYKKR